MIRSWTEGCYEFVDFGRVGPSEMEDTGVPFEVVRRIQERRGVDGTVLLINNWSKGRYTIYIDGLLRLSGTIDNHEKVADMRKYVEEREISTIRIPPEPSVLEHPDLPKFSPCTITRGEMRIVREQKSLIKQIKEWEVEDGE